MLSVGHDLTGRELLALQRRAVRHVSFSVTQACPLTCAHCMIATVLPHDRAAATLDLAMAHRYACELPALSARGVEHVSFTGGEPLLARDVLDVLSRAAAAARIRTTVVTACFWAKTREAATQIVRSLAAIDQWHLSADRYHQDHLPLDYVVRAADAVVGEGRQATVRMAVPLPIRREDEELHRRLVGMLPAGVPVDVQRVSLVGRAEALDADVPPARGRPGLCMSTGPVVRSDGTASPCCSSLVDARAGHPFEYPRADIDGLTALYDAWRADPLLTLIRAVGFAPVLTRVAEMLPDHAVLVSRPDHPCDLCVALWRDPRAAGALRAWADAPAFRQKVAAVERAVFDDALEETVQPPS